MKMRVIHLLLPLLWGFMAALCAQEEDTELLVDGLTPQSVIYRNYRGGLIVGPNGVAVRYGPTVLVANTVSIDENSGEVQAQGGVSIQRDAYLWKGEHVGYNIKTREMKAEGF